MRKIAAVAASAVVLTAGLQAPAWAAAPATDFELSWQGRQIHLTWKDSDEENIVLAEYADLGQTYLFENQPAGGTNEVTKFSTLYPSDKVRFILRTVASDGSSEDTLSPWFDTRHAVAPVLQDANLLPNLSTQLKWTQATIEDKTPGDPFDVPSGEKIQALVDLPGTATAGYDFAAGTTSGVVPAQARPAAIKVVGYNNWGEAEGTKTVRLGTLGAGITVPASAVYGARLGIKSTLDLFTSQGREERASGIKVELQARGKTTDAWKTYGRYAGNTTTAFDTGIGSLGNRQYRLFVPARKVASGNVIVLTPATSTSAKSSKTMIKFVSKGFTPAAASTGTKVDITAKIQPGVTVRGTLQDLVGSRWTNLFAVQFTKGSMLKHARAGVDKPGTYRYRIVLPAITVNGLTLSATTSPTFNFTLR
ncbi:hypothetical protein E1263_23750 [Kribbella antibiotica]|uniref:Fibronectin type III domain-containing protein n=1 Tax=Kribbella antibiotica TaxID=190195 RepID=A0A4V2YPA0_9ACTN|nr:hypothetical protein [Kribbella antibiotica]TDD57467.1 hypothetical protein E1263_23750 [Kribbella antibiotica]